MMRSALAALGAAILLSACAENALNEPPSAYADVDYDGWYDGFHDPFQGGFWGPHDRFYYGDGQHHFHPDRGGHFRHAGGGGMQPIHGHAPMVEFAFLAGAASAAALGYGGQEIAEHGSSAGAPPYASCHGPQYKGDPAIGSPAIAGLPASFIVQRFDHYAGPDGHNAIMRQVASSLSPAERRDVAAYISSLPKLR